MASFLASASSFFNRTNLSANYSIEDSQSAFHVGLWKVYKANRNSNATASGNGAGSTSTPTGNASRSAVSIWVHSLSSRGKEREVIVAQLKKEASSLTRLRHPCILEVVEPLEETRSEITFATELVTAPLSEALIADSRSDFQLDEVETQKGLLQISRGLEFLHGAGMVHGNLTPEALLINSKGDWKVGGFSFLTSLTAPDGTPTPFTHPDYDPSLPPALSRNFDYLDPVYALDESRLTANDMYSLGCLVYAAHSKGSPPFRNRNSLVNLRQSADQLSTITSSSSWSRMGKDVLDLLSSLLTRFPGNRLSAQAFGDSPYFNNILVSTLKFMERESFAGRSKDERVSFLKGLLKILPSFSDRLLRRKVLPALLELMSDKNLLPFILPNVFHISKNLSSIEFTSSVLPRLKPLFDLQDPPQNQLMLLDQIELFVQKTSPSVFREEVTPLLYSSLEAEQAMVQERALQTVPRLCEILEYSHIKEITFPAMAKLFVKTKVLSVKCRCLIAFHSLVDTLDKVTLTEKLVPILARIKTREPSVMVATLAVHEALSKKVDRETLATAIIPQLWNMSMGPLLNAEQFAKFMQVCKDLGKRVEEEHLQHLREVRRVQEHTDSHLSGGGTSGGVIGIGSGDGEMDFARLVGSGKNTGSEIARDGKKDLFDVDDPFGTSNHPFGSSNPSGSNTPFLTPSHTGTGSMPSNSTGFNNSLSSTSIRPSPLARVSSSNLSNGTPTSNYNSSSSILSPPPPPSTSTRLPGPPTNTRPLTSSNLSSSSSPALAASWNSTLTPSSNFNPPIPNSASNSANGGPNYNITLAPATGSSWNTPSNTSNLSSSFSLPPALPSTTINSSATPPAASWNSVMQPNKSSSLNNSKKQAHDWKDFDPFS